MAPDQQRAIISATASLPSIYRLILTTIEPLAALNGALLAFFTPQTYLSTMTRDAAAFRPDTRFLYTELGGAWLYFAFVEAVVLRRFDDLSQEEVARRMGISRSMVEKHLRLALVHCTRRLRESD